MTAPVTTPQTQQLPSAAMLARFFELSLDLVCVVNAQGAVTQVNPAFRRLLGWARNEVVGRPFFDIVHPDEAAAVRLTLAGLVQSQSKGTLEMRLRAKDGVYKRFQWQVQAEASGVVYAIGREVTPPPAPAELAPAPYTNGHTAPAKEVRSTDSAIRHRAELMVQAGEEHFRKTVASVPGLVYTFKMTADGKFSFPYLSDGVRELFEVTPEQGQADVMLIVNQIHPDDLPPFQNSVLESAAALKPYEWESRFVTPSGKLKWIRAESKPERLPNGDTLWYGYMRETTQRKQTEQDLLTHRFALEQALDAIFITDAQGIITYVNPAFVKTYGFTPAEALGCTPRILKSGVIPPERYAEFWGALLSGHVVAGEIINKTKDGRLIPIEGANNPILDSNGNLIGFMSVHRDITERKDAEGQLRLQAAALDSVSNAIVVTDPAGIIQWVNPAFTRTTGYTLEEAVGQSTRLLKSGQHGPEFYREMWGTILAGKVWRGDVINRRKDGTLYTEDQTITPVKNERGEVTGFVVTKQDITDRKRAESQLRLQATALDSVANGVVITDRNGTIQWVNPAFTRNTGYTLEEAVGQNPRILKSGEHGPEFYHDMWQTVLTGKIWRGEIVNRRKDGSHYTEDQTITPIRNEEGEITRFVVTKQDISARKQAEAVITRRAAELAATNRVIQVAASSTDLRTILRTTARELLELLGLRNCGVALLDATRSNLVLTADANADPNDQSAEGTIIPVAGNLSTERVLATKRPLVIDNAQTDPLTAPIHHLMRMRQTNGLMIVPLLRRGEVIGTVGCDLTDPARTFAPEEVALVENIAGQLAGAIENLRLFEEAQRRGDELETVAQVSTAASGTLNPQVLLQNTVDLTKQNFRLYHAHIYLLNEPKDTLVLAAGAGEVGRVMMEQGWRIPADRAQSLVARAARTRQAVIINDVQADPGWLPNTLLPNTRAEMALPLMVAGEVLGVLDVQAEVVGRFDDSDARIMSTLAAQIATALQNARLFQQTERAMGELNTLTQRLTREGWQSYLAEHHHEHQAYLYDLTQVRALKGTGAITTGPLNGDAKLSRTAADTRPLSQPLKVQGQTIGQLAVAETFVPEDEAAEIMAAVADRLGAHLENLRLSEQTQTALAQTAEQAGELRALFAAMPDVVLVYDRDGRYVRIAPTNPKLLYRPPEDMLGKTVYEVLPAEQAKIFHGYIRQVLTTHQTLDVEYELNITGEIVHFSASIVPLTEHTVFWIARDITERKRAEEASEKRASELATVAQVSTVASTLLERQHLLNEVVNLTQQRFGLYHANIYLFDDVGQTLNLHAASGAVGERMVEEGRSIPLLLEHSTVARAARERKAVVVNDVHESAGFVPHSLLPSTRAEMAVPMLVGDRLLGVFDVQAEQAGRFTEDDTRIHTTLSAQVAVALQNATLYAEQTATVARLKELDQLKSSFLANMSHELRTPLNSILGFTDVIIEGLDGPLTGQMETDLKVVQKNGQHLLKLINDILDMAKIEAGRMTISPEPVDLTDVVAEVVETTAPLAREKKLLLNSDVDPVNGLVVEADRMRLRQVLLNLVGNSIKFTERGSVTVTAENLGEHVLLCVKDTGIGIPPEQLEAIFEAFSQVDTSTTRKAGGTGLGLPISRHLIELHGGRLWAESSGLSGEGARFFVELPIRVHRPFSPPEGFVSEGYSG